MAPSIAKSVNKVLGSAGKKTFVGSLDKFILYNKFFLWGVLAFSLLNLLYMVSGRDYFSVVVFLLVGFLTSFFSKNMVVILLVATVVANIVRFGARNVSEGMKGDDDDDEDDDEDNTESNKNEKKENFDEYSLDEGLSDASKSNDEKEQFVEGACTPSKLQSINNKCKNVQCNGEKLCDGSADKNRCCVK